jgi:transposase
VTIPSKRRRCGINEVAAFLADDVAHRPRPPPRRPLSEAAKLFRAFHRSKATKHLLRREHSNEKQALVIFLRFGSLHDDGSPWLRANEVHRRTGVRPSTQCAMIKRWRARGFIVTKTRRRGVPPKLTPAQAQWLVSLDTLQQMSHLSLRKRAAVVRERFGLATFDHSTVRDYYRRHGVRYKRPDYKFWKSSADLAGLREQQLEFVQRLGQLLIDRTYDEVVYIDETTCNLWQRVSKCWLTPGMRLPLLKTRGHSITVIGAISAARGLVHAEVLSESNNAEIFRNFIEALKAKCAGRRVLLVMDNLRIHHAKLLHGTYGADFREMFLPPYSSPLNPIERLWSVLKRAWTRNLFHVTEALTAARGLRSVNKRAEAHLREIIGKVPIVFTV